MSPTVVVRDVTKRFARTQALAGVTVEVSTGVTGLLGPNGAGKTTLLRILATVLGPDDGSVRTLGLDPADARDRTRIRRSLGYLPQEPGFQRGFSVFEFVDYVAILKELTPARRRHDEVRRVIAAVDLTSVSDKRVRALSGGMRRRVALAAALLGDPQLLVLDEPTAGLDPEQRLRFVRERAAGPPSSAAAHPRGAASLSAGVRHNQNSVCRRAGVSSFERPLEPQVPGGGRSPSGGRSPAGARGIGNCRRVSMTSTLPRLACAKHLVHVSDDDGESWAPRNEQANDSRATNSEYVESDNDLVPELPPGYPSHHEPAQLW